LEQANDGEGSGDNGGEDDVGQFQLLNSDRREPYGLLYQNIRSLITRNSKKKIDYLKEYTQENEQKNKITKIIVDHIPWKILKD